MMESVVRISNINGELASANAVDGKVKFNIVKSMWNLGMICAALFFAPMYYSTSALVLFALTTYFSLLIGHSVGMHRMMIHRTFESYPMVEKLLIYIGVLVGMAGPLSIICIHDVRDWAQRQVLCHDFFSHRQNYVVDLWWQLTSIFVFSSSPKVVIEKKYSEDPWYLMLEKSWRLHQIGLAIIFYLIGGWPWVVWGIFVRIAVSIVGHWSITYICHNPGPGKWWVKQASVQASNIPGLGILTYGECWHNNHHAFPESAKIGLQKGQSDPAWWFICALQKSGLAWSIGRPRSQQKREDLLLRK